MSVPYEQVRCSAADREAVVERLRGALGQGRLTIDEFDERATAAASATTQGDLAALTRDLPGSLW